MEVVFCRMMVEGHQLFSLLGLRRDLLFLENPISGSYSLLDGPGGSSLGTLMRWLSGDIKKSLCAFAMSGFLWRMADQTRTLELLMQFERLEELYVTALDISISTQLGQSWLDVGLNRAQSTMAEIGEEVKRSIDELSRQHPQWKTLIVRVLYNKSAVMVDLIVRVGLSDMINDIQCPLF